MREDARMLKRIGKMFAANTEKVIASFGDAKLLADYDGRLEIRGGSKDDRLAAMEWISLFMHEAVLRRS
jgi:hypothetical protein